LAWVERAGYQHLEDIEPITVAAYIETLQRQAAPSTVKQHMAAIPDAVLMVDRKRSPGHESSPGTGLERELQSLFFRRLSDRPASIALAAGAH
jgi:hypothetical protein